AGLRTPADAAAILRALAVDQLQPLAGRLSAATSEQAVAGALASVLEWPEPAELVAAVVAACARLAAAGSGPYADACAAAVRVAADHPGDIGVLALLLMLLDPAVLVPVLSPRVLADGVTWFDTPAPEFRLYLLDLTGLSVTLPGHGPRILLCLDGACVLRSASGETLELRRGASCFISAADAPVHAAGSAHLALAT